MSSKKTNLGQRKSLLTGASVLAAAAAAMAGAPAMAQDADEEEAIVVTGSRIPQPNLVTTSPVTQLTAEDITTAGVTRVEDLTNELPQVFAAQGSNVSNGASGTAQVNLRGLGAGRTLVLIDGHRMAYGSPNSVPADLNQIPGAMVERVEVLTGGASAVYGSDAIAGVVNFIMRDDFEGFRVDAQYGYFQHSNDYDEGGFLRDELEFRGSTNPSQFQLPEDNVDDGFGKEITAIFGVSSPDGRGNVTAYMGYRSNDAILQRDRDFSACALANPSTSARPYAPAGTVHWNCGGSATSFPGYFYFGGNTASLDPVTGDFVAWDPNVGQYNFGPTNYYQRPDERYTLGAFARYEINEHVEAYAQAMFMDYRSVAQIAPSGNFFNTTTINCGNPLLPSNTTTFAGGLCTPAEVAANTVVPLYIGRRNVEGGGRRDDLNYESYRMLAGLRGPISENWDYDLSASYSRVNLARTYNNDFSVTRLGRALNVITGDGTGELALGEVGCASFDDGTDPNCVPWDIFTPGGVTDEALAYLQIPLIQRGATTQQVVIGSLTGDLGIGSPMAESNIYASFGFEYRRDELLSTTDAAFQSGDGAGQGGPTLPLEGSTDVFELFGEARIPLVEDAPFAELLSVDVAYRYSEYNSGTNTDTYKIGGEWAPTEDLRLRASFTHAVRAPNIIELFAAQGGGLFNQGYDPCDDLNNDAAGVTAGAGGVPAQCIGVNPWQVTAGQSDAGTLNNPAGQYNGLFGGNPDLNPEEADTTTIGFVFTPSFVPGLSVSVDYFDIEVTDLITATGTGVLAACYDNNDLAACALITRNPTNGRLWGGNAAYRVEAVNTNIGGLQTSGFDISADYRTDIGSWGSLSFALVGTKLEELITNEGGSRNPYDCAGLWSGNANCGIPNPEWRHRFRVSWETPFDVEFSGTWRYFSEVHREVNVLGQGGFEADPTTVANTYGTVFDEISYFDIAGNWDVLENTRLRFGINNVLDTDPPISTNTNVGAGFGNGNTFPQVYDATGRWIFVGATVDF